MNPHVRRTWIVAALVLLAGVLGYLAGHGHRANAHHSPLIGISSHLTSDPYVRAVRMAGGIPVVLPDADGSDASIGDYLVVLDGLLMPGGADIPPAEYGEVPHATVVPLDHNRYLFEKALSRAWISRTAKPLLGICLGSQWINVASGGSLVQDIPSEFHVNHRDTTHAVKVDAGSRLGRILGKSELVVNSFHHQAVGKPGNNLRVVARSPEGVVEAIETTDPARFLIGVQWHPEKMPPDDIEAAKLLKAFVKAAAESYVTHQAADRAR